jgi:hypothetical protein
LLSSIIVAVSIATFLMFIRKTKSILKNNDTVISKGKGIVKTRKEVRFFLRQESLPVLEVCWL